MGAEQKTKHLHEIHILAERCKGCSFCIDICPFKVLDQSDKFNSKGFYPPYVKEKEKCTACMLCELICPDFALYIKRSEEND